MTASTPPTRERGLPGHVRFYLEDHDTPLGMAVDVTLLVLNLAFIAVFVLETYSFPERVETLLWDVELAIAVVFLAEYLLRLYAAPNTLDEFLDPYTLVDLAAILPTFLIALPWTSLGVLDVGFLRVLRVVRVLRFYRFTRDEEFFFGTIEVQTLRATKLVLTVLSIFFVAAGLFYAFEHPYNPGVSNFGDAFYFTVVTLATVGFGDIVPVTSMGRLVTVGAIIAGIILIPWQAGRIVRAWSSKETVDVTCPNCGLSRHDPDASHCKACGHALDRERAGAE